ncbi:MAG: TlpA disulfide reductase family protein [Actinomycetota bacterium]|nr:TlpA disulfide reductase family protein [Actinomycetota bacterium]
MTKRRELAFLVPALLVTLAALPGCGRDQPVQVGTTVIDSEDRAALPPIAGPTLDGGMLDLADLRGRVVVLNSWASWCEPCRAELPALVDLAADADPRKVAVVGLNVSDDSDAAAAFADSLGVTYPSIVDPEGDILPTVPGVPPASLPSTVILDRDGRVAVRIIGEVDPATLPALVAGVVAEPAQPESLN